MKKTIFLIALAVLISGCTASPEVSDLLGYPGVSITEFYPLSSTVMEGGEIDLLLQVQNTGHFDAIDVDVMLFGCGTSEESADATWVCDDYSDLEAKLSKPDLELNVPGEITETQFRLTAPDNIIGGKISHTFLSRVRYDYSTSAGADVVLSSFENWKASNQQIDVGALNSYSTDAPMSIDINVPLEPVIIPADSNEDKFITIAVIIRNSGNGIVNGGELGEVRLYYDTSLLSLYSGDFTQATASDNMVTVSDSSKLQLIGLANQWNSYKAIFKIKTTSEAPSESDQLAQLTHQSENDNDGDDIPDDLDPDDDSDGIPDTLESSPYDYDNDGIDDYEDDDDDGDGIDDSTEASDENPNTNIYNPSQSVEPIIQEVISFSAEADYTYIEEGQATVVIEE